MKFYNKNLNILLRQYLPTIAAAAGRYMSPFDWVNEYKIWEDQLKQCTNKLELDKLENAFKKTLSREDIKKMPTPGLIKGIIRDEAKPEYKPKPEREKCNPKIRDLFREFCKVLGKKCKCRDNKEKEKLTVQCNELISKIQAMSKGGN